MSDRFFFLIVIILISAMIAIAFFPLYQKQKLYAFAGIEDAREGFIIEDKQLSLLKSSPYTSIELNKNTLGKSVAYLSASKEWKNAPSKGIYLSLPISLEQSYAGNEIILKILARSMSLDHPVEFGFGYFTSGEGDSGFRRFRADSNMIEHELKWRVPYKTKRANNDFICIWPDFSGKKQTLIIESISLKVLHK